MILMNIRNHYFRRKRFNTEDEKFLKNVSIYAMIYKPQLGQSQFAKQIRGSNNAAGWRDEESKSDDTDNPEPTTADKR